MSDWHSALVLRDDKKRLVEGFANVSVLDRQGDVVPAEAMSAAMIDYMAKGGIILLSHENKPVGKVLQWDVQKTDSGAEGIHIIAEIHADSGIGDAAWKMLKEKTLTGFSIGGVAKKIQEIRAKGATGGVARQLSNIELNEISLVQIPANQMSTVENLSLAKGVIVVSDQQAHVSAKHEAEALAQKLKQEGKVVYRIIAHPDGFEIQYGDHINPQTGQKQPFVGKDLLLSALMGIFTEKAEDAPPEEEFEHGEKKAPIALEENTNFDQTKYGLAAKSEMKLKPPKQPMGNGEEGESGEEGEPAESVKDAVSSGEAGVDNPRYSPEEKSEEVQKPFKSRAQQRWAFWSRQPWAEEWAGKTRFGSLPERAHRKDMHPAEAAQRDTVGVCDVCGEQSVDVTEDKYGPSFCQDCEHDVEAYKALVQKFVKDRKLDSWRCIHCGSMTEAPKASAPNDTDYRWCPTCKQHRNVREKDEAHKDVRDGATADANVGENGIGRGDRIDMSLNKKGEGAYCTKCGNALVLKRDFSIAEWDDGVQGYKPVCEGGMRTGEDGKSINTPKSMDKTMPKPVRKEPDPEPDPARKSDTEILPYSEEEKRLVAAHRALHKEPDPDPDPAAKPVPDESEAEEAADQGEMGEGKGVAPVPHKTTAEDFRSLADSLVKAISDGFARMEKRFETLEKANYTSKPPSVEHDYPKPPEDGPKSDGLQAPKLDQEMNPHSKPFGKTTQAIIKTALGGAADGSKEGPVMEGNKSEFVRKVLTKGTNASEMTQRRMRGEL
jgi:HK97 family phage prohead protease